jgi:pilus assembly protein CpaC
LNASVRRFLCFAILGLSCLTHSPDAMAQTPVPVGTRGTLAIEVGSGQVITFPSAVANIFVADPKIAGVHAGSPVSLFVFGVGVGRTSVAALDIDGHLISQYEVTVEPSPFAATAAQGAILRLMPGTQVKVQAQAKGLMLSGHVETPADAARMVAIARGYLAENQVVENQLSIQSTIQVTLRVRVAEMSRQVVRNLGINWQALGTIGSIGHLPALTLNLNANTLLCASPLAPVCGGGNFNGIIDALAQDNLAHVLTEPNLTVMSGQTASFLVGGEFPIPVGQQGGQVTVEFKKYGITLSFLPTVLSEGRINIHVSPEVSQLTTQGAVQLTASNTSLQIPALLVRRAETTVELGSGQSFAIAGLLQDNISQGGNGLPFLSDIPVLGAVFKSSAFQRTQTELVIIVTPIIVQPVSNEALLHLPTDGVTVPGDLDRILLHRQVGRPQAGLMVRIPGDAGFVVQ